MLFRSVSQSQYFNIDRQLNFQGITDTPNTVYKPSIAPPIPFDTSSLSGDEIGISTSDIQTNLPLGSLGEIVGPGSLADYMGEAPGSIVTDVIDLTPYVGYVDIYYNYYLNQQYDLVPTSLAGTESDSATEYPYYLPVSDLEGYLRVVKTTPITSPAIREDSSASYSTNVDVALNAIQSDAFVWNFFTGRQSLFQRGFPSYYLEAWLKTSSFSDAAIDISVSGNSVSMRNITFASRMQRYMDLAFADRVRIQTAIDSIIAAHVPFYFTIEQELFDSESKCVIYEFKVSDLFFFIFARFSGSCCAYRSLSSRRPRKRKTSSEG